MSSFSRKLKRQQERAETGCNGQCPKCHTTLNWKRATDGNWIKVCPKCGWCQKGYFGHDADNKAITLDMIKQVQGQVRAQEETKNG